jgi:hypothetical protein
LEKSLDAQQSADGAAAQEIVECHLCRVVIIEESQPVKNRNLSRVIANLSLQNWPSARNSVYCFSTVFPLLHHNSKKYCLSIIFLG